MITTMILSTISILSALDSFNITPLLALIGVIGAALVGAIASLSIARLQLQQSRSELVASKEKQKTDAELAQEKQRSDQQSALVADALSIAATKDTEITRLGSEVHRLSDESEYFKKQLKIRDEENDHLRHQQNATQAENVQLRSDMTLMRNQYNKLYEEHQNLLADMMMVKKQLKIGEHAGRVETQVVAIPVFPPQLLPNVDTTTVTTSSDTTTTTQNTPARKKRRTIAAIAKDTASNK